MSDTLAPFLSALGHDVIVDHSAPLHDAFCRCRACKPPIVGTTGQALARVRMAAMVGVALTAAIVGGHAGGAL